MTKTREMRPGFGTMNAVQMAQEYMREANEELLRYALECSIRELDDPDVEVRKKALDMLMQLLRRDIYDARCLPRLIELMDDADGAVRLNICDALNQMSTRATDMLCDRKQLAKAINLLDDKIPLVRINSAGLIGKLSQRGVCSEDCLVPLVKMLADDVGDVRWSAEICLCQLAEREIYDPSTLCYAIALLDDKQATFAVNRAAHLIAGLAKNGVYDAACLPRLVEELDAQGDYGTVTRIDVSIALNELAVQDIFDPNCLDKVLEQFDTGDWRLSPITAVLVGTLAMNGLYDARCVPKLLQLFDKSSGHDWKRAVLVLGNLDRHLTVEERQMIVTRLRNEEPRWDEHVKGAAAVVIRRLSMERRSSGPMANQGVEFR